MYPNVKRFILVNYDGTGDPLTHRHSYVSHPGMPRRKKPAPDPDVRRAIVAAASKSVREQGVRGLNVATVLAQARLSTRAFYRHFESKDQLVAAVYVEITRAEVLRLREKMTAAATPIEAVAAWIDGRLDLAFDEDAKVGPREVSLEAHSNVFSSTVFSSTEMVSPAYSAILEPLIEQLQRGLELGVFKDIVPMIAAKSIQGVVWAGTQQLRAMNRSDPGRFVGVRCGSACADWAWRKKRSNRSPRATRPWVAPGPTHAKGELTPPKACTRFVSATGTQGTNAPRKHLDNLTHLGRHA
jgi:AcrR family transcriptional regulator